MSRLIPVQKLQWFEFASQIFTLGFGGKAQRLSYLGMLLDIQLFFCAAFFKMISTVCSFYLKLHAHYLLLKKELHKF